MKGAKDFLKVVGACLVLIALFQLGLFVLGFYCDEFYGQSTGAAREYDPIPDSDTVVRLLSAGTFRCSFPGFSEDLVFIRNAGVDHDLAAVHTAHGDGLATLIGNQETVTVAIFANRSVSFVERFNGGLAATTIYPWASQGADSVLGGRLEAVHSRHTAVAGPSPSQIYGSCLVFEAAVLPQ